MLTIDDALLYLGIDYADKMVTSNVARALETAKGYLQSAVGADIFDLLPDDPKADQLLLAYLQDLYDERGTSAKVGNAKREMVHSMEWQLRLELAAMRDAAEAAGV